MNTLLQERTSTTASKEPDYRSLLARSQRTTSGVTPPSANSPEVTQKAINKLRRLSGLTWDQLATLFNVSRRSLHFWASGQPLSSFNEGQLNLLLHVIQYIDRGSASLNRSLLLQRNDDGSSFLDLLIAGKYEVVKENLGFGNAPQKPKLGSLSDEERKMRLPIPPDVLANPLPDISYQQTGRSRPARAARSRKNING